MKTNYDTIIAGAGPAGLFCAITASQGGRRILVLEKNRSAGKKLLLSGSGQCNFTHTGETSDFIRHYGSAGNFVKPAISAFTNSDLVRFFEEHGIETVTRPDGKVFPASMSAGHILSLLLHLCAENSVEIKYGLPAERVSCHENYFSVSAGGEIYTSRNFVITCGGSSYPATGSSGDGYSIAASLGHSITEISPALTPLHIRNYTMGGFSGISVRNSRITVHRDNRKISTGYGDILFTPKGLSGPGILDISRDVRSGDIVTLSLTDLNVRECEARLAESLKSEGKKSVRNMLKVFEIPERLAEALLEKASIDPSKKSAEITRGERVKLLELINSFPFEVYEKGNLKAAMATAGGICREEIERRTMESKIVKGLFFAGEVMDVDGDTGGYNIQWAFSSGRAAGDAILKQNS